MNYVLQREVDPGATENIVVRWGGGETAAGPICYQGTGDTPDINDLRVGMESCFAAPGSIVGPRGHGFGRRRTISPETSSGMHPRQKGNAFRTGNAFSTLHPLETVTVRYTTASPRAASTW